MPNTKSAKKSLQVGIRRNGENRRIKLGIRKVLKDNSAENLNEIFSTLDKAAKKNVIHPNKAARLKSRASKKISTNTEDIKTPPKKTAVKKTTAKRTSAKKTTKKTGK